MFNGILGKRLTMLVNYRYYISGTGLLVAKVSAEFLGTNNNFLTELLFYLTNFQSILYLVNF